MKTVLVLRHLAFEDLGSLGMVLAERGYQARYLDIGVAALSEVDALADDLLVVLGGPIGVYEDAAYPYVREELALLQQRLAAQKPVLGICLGAQLMAAALGGRVYPGGNGKEIGWSALQLGADAPLFMSALAGVPVLHWHGDTFDLPEGAQHLAASAQYANQVFAVGDYALGLQCHPEVRLRDLERWYIGHACEIGKAGLSVPTLREQGMEHAPALEKAAERFWALWLDSLPA